MIVEEAIGKKLVKIYSSDGKDIKQTEMGIIAKSVIDSNPTPYTYIEIDEPVPVDDDIDDSEALDIILGGAE